MKQKIRFCAAHDGARIAYATSGSGPPLVKASNWLSHLEFDLESPVWGHMMESLSRDYTVLRYDQRGSGLSDWEVDDISFEAWVRDLETVVDASGFERFPLLGISQGASIAIAYAVRHPERVTHLILHGGYARGRCRRGEGPSAAELAEAMARLAELGWGQNDESFRQIFTQQFIPGGTSKQMQWFNELERLSTSPRNAATMMREFNDIDVSGLLSQIRCPTIVLHATGDLRVPFAEGRLIAGRIAEARFVPLNTRHHLVLEQDAVWPRWIEDVREFLGTANFPQADPQFVALTPREHELVELVAQGRDNSQIAAVMQLTNKTVRNHITNVFAKLEVENRSQAIVLARNAGYGAHVQSQVRSGGARALGASIS